MIWYILCAIFGVVGCINDVLDLIKPERLQNEDGNMPSNRQICFSIIISWVINLVLFSYGIYNLVK